MKKKIKSYLAFSAGLNRAVFLIGEVLLAILAVSLPLGTENYAVVACVAAEILLGGEVLADFWMFGGIASKDSGLPEYLKTSPNGMQLLKNAVIVNLVRQLVVTLLVSAVVRGICYNKKGEAYWDKEEILIGLAVALLAYLYMVLGTMAGRFFATWNMQMMVAMAAAILMGFSTYICRSGNMVALLVLAVLAALASVASMRIIIRKGEESYYDKAD